MLNDDHTPQAALAAESNPRYYLSFDEIETCWKLYERNAIATIEGEVQDMCLAAFFDGGTDSMSKLAVDVYRQLTMRDTIERMTSLRSESFLRGRDLPPDPAIEEVTYVYNPSRVKINLSLDGSALSEAFNRASEAMSKAITDYASLPREQAEKQFPIKYQQGQWEVKPGSTGEWYRYTYISGKGEEIVKERDFSDCPRYEMGQWAVRSDEELRASEDYRRGKAAMDQFGASLHKLGTQAGSSSDDLEEIAHNLRTSCEEQTGFFDEEEDAEEEDDDDQRASWARMHDDDIDYWRNW